jgi:hypothetical protein
MTLIWKASKSISMDRDDSKSARKQTRVYMFADGEMLVAILRSLLRDADNPFKEENDNYGKGQFARWCLLVTPYK